MKIEMPYGEVEINTKEQAQYFIMNYCANCNRNNEMNPCSYAISKKCDDAKLKVYEKFFESYTYLYIKNARDEVVAKIVLDGGVLREDKFEKCFVEDIDGDGKGNTVYTIQLMDDRDLIEEFSTDDLLDELRMRVNR